MRHPKDIEACESLDIDAIGLILVPNRRRTVTMGIAKEIVNRVPDSIAAVGVMANPSMDEVKQWVEHVPLDRIQLHGNESPECCHRIREEVGIPIIKVMHVDDQGESSGEVGAYASVVDAVLLDSGAGPLKGGSGQTFSWDKIPSLVDPWQKEGIPVWIAGGLHPENVAELVRRFAIAGVDTSSGVETAEKKDPKKMATFVERVRNVDNE